MKPMTLDQAKRVRIQFGKYAGRTLEEIADEDVLYLDWLIGLTNLREPLKTAVGIVHEDRRAEVDQKISDQFDG